MHNIMQFFGASCWSSACTFMGFCLLEYIFGSDYAFDIADRQTGGPYCIVDPLIGSCYFLPFT